MGAENVRFRSYDHCLDTLVRMGADRLDVENLLGHERGHYEKAVELGFKPIYGIWLVPDFPPLILAGYIDFEGAVPQGQDMIDILMAPTVSREDDIKLVKRIENGYQC